DSGSNGDILLARVRPSDAGAYACKGELQSTSNSVGGSIDVSVVEVRVYQPPVIVRGPSTVDNSKALQGRTVEFECLVEGFPAPQIYWLVDNRSIDANDPDTAARLGARRLWSRQEARVLDFMGGEGEAEGMPSDRWRQVPTFTCEAVLSVPGVAIETTRKSFEPTVVYKPQMSPSWQQDLFATGVLGGSATMVCRADGPDPSEIQLRFMRDSLAVGNNGLSGRVTLTEERGPTFARLTMNLVDKSEPILHNSEPILHNSEPILHNSVAILHNSVAILHNSVAILHNSEPILHNSEPILHNSEPILHNSEPILHNSEPILHNSEPILHNSEPILHNSEPILHNSEPILHNSEPILHNSEPILHNSEPILHNSEPILHNSEPILHNSEPILHNSEPILHNSEPILHNSEPILHSLCPDLRRSDAGQFACVAATAAGSVTRLGQLDVQFAPTILEPAQPVRIYSWHQHSTTLTCKADGRPQPEFTWELNGSPLSTQSGEPAYRLNTRHHAGDDIFIAELSFTPTVSTGYGSYTCLVANSIGSVRSPTIGVFEARRPGTPDVDIDSDRCSPTSLVFSVVPPVDTGGAPLSGYEIAYRVNNGPEIGPAAFSLNREIRLNYLQPRTNYKVYIAARNLVGSGGRAEINYTTGDLTPPAEFRLDADFLSDDPDGLLLRLNVLNDGGLPIDRYRVRLRRVRGSVGPDGRPRASAPLTGWVTLNPSVVRTASSNGHLRLDRLKPGTFYEVQVQIGNPLGMSDRRRVHVFRTAGRPHHVDVYGSTGGSARRFHGNRLGSLASLLLILLLL
uniref:Basement membrane proteoglycan n=1 Tax=Macrostomum lignano TaxID=282301 RepID=A0A1I8IGR8_9PLAT